MIIANNGVVQCTYKNCDDLLMDTESVVSTFIKITKEAKMSDELIEKTLVTMIARGFENIKDAPMYRLNRETGELN